MKCSVLKPNDIYFSINFSTIKNYIRQKYSKEYEVVDFDSIIMVNSYDNFIVSVNSIGSFQILTNNNSIKANKKVESIVGFIKDLFLRQNHRITWRKDS